MHFHSEYVIILGKLQQFLKTFSGILNIHASLLPRWRGAAPIIHALANGDTETGITVMRIKPKHFDTGDIVMQNKVQIEKNMKMLELHKILGELGGFCVLSTLKQLPEALQGAKPQPNVGVTFGKTSVEDYKELMYPF